MKVRYRWPLLGDGEDSREFECENTSDYELIARLATGNYTLVRMWGHLGDTRTAYVVDEMIPNSSGFSCRVGGLDCQKLVCEFNIGGPW